jgi:hypothetical protein
MILWIDFNGSGIVKKINPNIEIRISDLFNNESLVVEI